jgi:hypothetical protein
VSGKRILLVEGSDDEHVIKHLCGAHGVGPLDDIKAHGGVHALLESFPVRLKESEVHALGVVVDADENPEARWRALADSLRRAGYSGVPHGPVEGGAILDAPAGTLLPRVGVWLMPDNHSTGMLETFLEWLVPPGSTLFEHVKAAVASIPPGEQLFRRAHATKALIYTWLAWQKEPGKPLGTAITMRYLDPTLPAAEAMVQWLQRLFRAS